MFAFMDNLIQQKVTNCWNKLRILTYNVSLNEQIQNAVGSLCVERLCAAHGFFCSID